MKILILGSNGLVGSSLVRNLSNEFNVISSTRKDTNLFSLIETDSLIQRVKPNIIINAAAKVGGIYANNSERTAFILENLKININLLESLIKFPEIKLFNLGSSCIYPLGAPNPISEKSLMSGKLEPTNSPYAMAKLTAIEISDALKKEYGHQITNIMPTNLYGPNDNFSEVNSHVIPGLIFRMHKAKVSKKPEFKVWGTGKPLREFMFVDDLSDSIKFMIKNNLTPEIINIGSGEEISIYNLVVKISQIMKYDGKIVFDETKPDGNPRKLLDSSLINSFGWQSKTELDYGLKLTIDWFEKNVEMY